MGATIDEVASLADVNKFFAETGNDTTDGACHNACAWLIVQIKKMGIMDYNVHWCVGSFNGLDHSWLLVEDTEAGVSEVIDMTVNQFVDVPVPYVGPMDMAYSMINSISLCEDDRMPAFVEALGF